MIKGQKKIPSRSSNLALNSIFLLFYLNEKYQICIHLVPEDSNKKQIILKNCVKDHLKIFLIRLCKIPYARRKMYLCFYKKSTNQTFAWISSKVVYIKKHLACQVQHP